MLEFGHDIKLSDLYGERAVEALGVENFDGDFISSSLNNIKG